MGVRLEGFVVLLFSVTVVDTSQPLYVLEPAESSRDLTSHFSRDKYYVISTSWSFLVQIFRINK
jgi:hypothetical protein